MSRSERLPQCDQDRAHQGFSLLEILLVLIIIGLAGALALPRLSGQTDTRSFDRFLAQIESAFVSAQLKARRDGQTVILEFDEPTRTFASSSVASITVPDDIDLELKTTGRHKTPRILFLPSGQSSGATLAISSARFEANITVDWLSPTIVSSGRMERSR